VFLFKRKKKAQKSPYIEEKKSEVAIFRQWFFWRLLEQIKIDSKEFLLSCLTSSQIWLIPLVNDHWSTYSTPQNWKKLINFFNKKLY
jgi:hypothetical protein